MQVLVDARLGRGIPTSAHWSVATFDRPETTDQTCQDRSVGAAYMARRDHAAVTFSQIEHYVVAGL